MRCSYCTLSAEAKCVCSRPFMCQTHLGPHMITMGNHSFEVLNVDLENERLNSLRSTILKEVQKVTILKVDITAKTRTLIKSIEKLFKLNLEKLDAISNSYLCILKQKKFTQSDLETIQKIEKMELKVKIIDIEKIKKQIDLDYSKAFLEYEVKYSEENIKVEEEKKRNEKERKIKEVEEEKKKVEEEKKRTENENKIKEAEEERLHPERSNNYTEMSLKQKIEYFCNIIPQDQRAFDLNWWQSHGKEILVTNDAKYLFGCKLYLGI